MEDEVQARAYAEADFSEPYSHFVELLQTAFPLGAIEGHVLDLGCGPGDITLRVAKAWPSCIVHGVDGAAAMLRNGEQAIIKASLEDRVQLVYGRLPEVQLPREKYDLIIRNSLLHHLHEPAILWDCIKRFGVKGAPVFIMDLRRPGTRKEAIALVERYAAGEPEILRRDFFNSLLAAFEPEEVQRQLVHAELDSLRVAVVSDRHLSVSGYLDPF